MFDSTIWVATAVALSLISGSQDQDPVTTLPDVEVRGAPLVLESAKSFVDEIAAKPFGALTLGRWETPICLEIINIEGEKPLILARRIMARAVEVGAPVTEGGCRPNVSVVLTADGSRTATDFVDVSPRAFRASSGPTQRSRAELDQFKSSDAPIRWWHVSGLYDTHHRAFISASGSLNIVNTDGAVYFNQDRRQAFLSTIVIVDVSRLKSIDLSTLADYLTFVILAEVGPRQTISAFPSILNVWNDSSGVTALTSWDLGYLNGLYSSGIRVSGSGTAVETGYQRAQIARSVLATARTAASSE